MKSKLIVGFISAVLLQTFLVSARQGCLELQSQTVKYVQMTKNVRRDNVAINVAINCCQNDRCCEPGIFRSGDVLRSNGKCLPDYLLTGANAATKCRDAASPAVKEHQRRATITGVKNGFSMRCFYGNEDGETFDEKINLEIKALPQLISFTQKVVEQPERGLLLTCSAALGTYTSDLVELSFLNYTTGEPSGPVGTTRWDERITTEMKGSEKSVADYLKSELNLTAPYQVELKHFIPDSVVYWRNLSIGCQLKLASRVRREDRIEFEQLDKSRRIKTINERDLNTLPKVEVKYDDFSRRIKCQSFSFPKATSFKWMFAPGRGENFTEIPSANISATESVSTDWFESWYNGPFDADAVYQCIVTNSIGSSSGELEFQELTTTTTSTTSTTTSTPLLNEDELINENINWEGPPDPLASNFPFYWVIVVVGILIIFAVAIAVILHLRKKSGSEYKSNKQGDASVDEEQQRLQQPGASSPRNDAQAPAV